MMAEASSNSFGLGFFDVILELITPIISNPVLIDKIDF